MTDLHTSDASLAGQLKSISRAIELGERPDPASVINLLSIEEAGQRFTANWELAKIYFYLAKDLPGAAVFAQRALRLSGLSEDFLAFYIELHTATGDVEAQRLAYKTMGMRYAAAGDIYSALRNFNLHRDAYALAGLGNQYGYDFDVLDRIDRLAERKKQRAAPPLKAAGNKVKVAYLVFHVHHPESVIVKLLCEFAKWHNAADFEAVFFIAESSSKNDAIALKNIAALTQAGARIVQANKADVMGCVQQIAEYVQTFKPHVFVTTAILADYAHYFVALISPATAHVGLSYGPPELYVAPRLDWVIASSDTLIIDSPVSASIIPVEYQLPARQSLTPRARSELSIAADALVLMSAGRPLKFMDRGFWNAISQVLELHPKAVFIAVGLDAAPPFLSELIPAGLMQRVMTLGWQSDYLGTLAMADIVVDTYPSGGGMVLIDAMALGIPVVSFHHDYTKPYDQMNWNLGEDLVAIPELIVGRYNLDGLKTTLCTLIQDPDLRKKLGTACHAIVHEQRSSPERYVRRHEKIYKTVLARKLEQAAQKRNIKWFVRGVARRALGALRRLKARS